MASSSTGRNPAQKASRVTRAGKMPKVAALGPGPVSAPATVARQKARRDGGPAKPARTPVPDRAAGTATSPLAAAGQPRIRDYAGSGGTIASRANASGKRRKAAG